MQYESSKVTKLSIRSDGPTAVSSPVHGANLHSYGFNMDYIVERNPMLALKIRELWHQADQLREEEVLTQNVSYRLSEAEQ